MKNAVIILEGLPGIDKPEVVKNFAFENESELLTELTGLQSGYCQDKERPSITRAKTTIKGKEREVVMCNSPECDWGYTAIIGMKSGIN